MNRTKWLSAIRSPAFLPNRPSLISKPRSLSTNPPKPDDLAPSASSKARTRISRLQSRLPNSLRGYISPIVNAPLTHISAFLLLHELTAVVPLLGLAATFHHTQWMPTFFGEGKWVADGVEKFGNYFRRKGWLGGEEGGRFRWWGRGERGTRVVVEFATAYAVTKALLPLRLILSVWATPWFARVAIVPCTSLFRRLFSRKHSK